MQRVKEPDKWLKELDLPLEGTDERKVADAEEELAQFSQFAEAMGIKPPKPSDDGGDVADWTNDDPGD